MSRLIEADAIPYVTDETYLHEFDYAYRYAIDALPTVDAVPVVHGKWEYGENESGYDGYYCSKCFGHVRWYGKASGQSINFIKKYNYCPNCGARMDGEA
jgi:hypothetical protein